jgi:DNA-binding MarR family transcriptional regulator
MPVSKEVLHVRKLSQQFAYTSIRMHESIGRKAGFAGTDHKYLGFFLQKGSMTAGDLAHLTGLTTGAVTGLIDRFEKKKLVKRQFDKDDRRKIIIVPDSEKIAALLKPFYLDFQNKTDKLLASFSPQELKVLERYFTDALNIANQKLAALNSEK